MKAGADCVHGPGLRLCMFGGGGLVAKSYPTLATPWTPRLLCPWDSPGKNTGVGCQFFFQINVCFIYFLFILVVPSVLAWRIPWMEEPGRRQSMGSQSQTRLSD